MVVHADFLTNYFLQQVSPALVTVILKEEEQDLSDNQFLAIKMLLKEKDEAGQKQALVCLYRNAQIGEPFCGAALQWRETIHRDVRRFNWVITFTSFLVCSVMKIVEGHMVKITRDAELVLKKT